MQFDLNHWWLRLAGWLTQFRWKAIFGGDQSLFINKYLFDDVGGYDENYILMNELYKRNEFTVINKRLKHQHAATKKMVFGGYIIIFGLFILKSGLVLRRKNYKTNIRS
jgi:hypothetical protein